MNAEDFGDTRWLAAITRLSTIISEATFAPALGGLLDDFLGIDHCSIFTFTRDGRRNIPGYLFACGKMPEAEAAELGHDYITRFHARDPQLSKGDAQDRGLIHARLQDEYDDEYRRHFFIAHHIIDKIATVNQTAAGAVYCNYYRMSGSLPFSAADQAALDHVLPLLSALVGQHYRLLKLTGRHDNKADGNVARRLIRQVFNRQAPPFDCLTRRESQICERILNGYTGTGISLDLGIAESSVNTYRRRAYEKLGIATQNELFSLCLSAIGKGQK